MFYVFLKQMFPLGLLFCIIANILNPHCLINGVNKGFLFFSFLNPEQLLQIPY